MNIAGDKAVEIGRRSPARKMRGDGRDASTAWDRPLDDPTPLSMTGVTSSVADARSPERQRLQVVPFPIMLAARVAELRSADSRGRLSPHKPDAIRHGGRFPWRRRGGRRRCIRRRLRGSGVADPLAGVGNYGLSGGDVDRSVLVFYAQRAFEDDGELVEGGSLTGFEPSGGTAHVGYAGG